MKTTVNGAMVTIKEYPAETAEDRIKRIEDKRSIEEIMFYYSRCADNLDIEGQASCFAEDGLMSMGDIYTQVYVGRESIKGFLKGALGAVKSGSHYNANFQLLFDGPDSAIGHMYMYSWQTFNNYPITSDCHRWGRYELRYTREEDGEWRIKSLTMLSSGEYGGHRACEQYGRPWPPVPKK